MALNYNILENKPTIHDKNGNIYLDLLATTYKKENNIPGQFLIVNKYYVARPDLISLAVYADDKYGDLICKVNGISNPFELNEDDVVFIPDVEYITKYSAVGEGASDLVTNETDDTLLAFNVGNQKKHNEKRTSNQQLVGETNYTIDNTLGLVFY